MRTGEPTDTIFATQGFALAICVDFNDLYFIFGMRIGISEFIIYRSKVLTKPTSVQEGSRRLGRRGGQ
jgi:hypothetical protein